MTHDTFKRSSIRRRYVSSHVQKWFEYIYNICRIYIYIHMNVRAVANIFSTNELTLWEWVKIVQFYRDERICVFRDYFLFCCCFLIYFYFIPIVLALMTRSFELSVVLRLSVVLSFLRYVYIGFISTAWNYRNIAMWLWCWKIA